MPGFTGRKVMRRFSPAAPPAVPSIELRFRHPPAPWGRGSLGDIPGTMREGGAAEDGTGSPDRLDEPTA